MSNDDDVVRMLKLMDALVVRMERGQATPEDHQEYDALADAVEARLGTTPDGPRRAVRRGAETEGMAA